jgi:HK97 gp10 family phage protein
MSNDYIGVEVKGLDKTMRALAAYGKFAQTKGAVAMTRTTANHFKRRAKANCPVSVKGIEGSSKRADKQPGNLRNSIKSIRILKGAQKVVYYRVGFTQGRKYKYDGWYANIVEFGAAPHTIPRTGLKTRMRIGNNYFIGPIQHPGHAPTRFVTRTFEEEYGIAIKKGQLSFDKTLKKFRGR